MGVQGTQKKCVQLMSLIVPADKISLLKARLHTPAALHACPLTGGVSRDRVSVAFPMEVKTPDLAKKAGYEYLFTEELLRLVANKPKPLETEKCRAAECTRRVDARLMLFAER